MDSLTPVTLVVKAPNQKIDDQVVECAMGWTIKKVKDHLSSVYPSKPSHHQQKLIYSGRLLSDHLQLKDVLRHISEARSEHTVHLVCSPSSLASSSSSSTNQIPATEIRSPEASQPQFTSPINTDGVRQRTVPDTASSPFHPTMLPQNQQMYGNQQYMQMQMPFMYQGAVDPQQYMWYQQMYAQQMAQYYQMYQQQYGNMASPTTTASPVPNAEAPAAAAPAANNNRGNQGGQNLVMNAQGGAVFDDEEGNNDWLDWFYIICRVGVLFSIVYFYSTFSRAVLAFIFFLLMYCYQMGWLNMDRRNQRNAQQPAAPEAPAQQPDPPAEREGTPEGEEENTEPEEETTEVTPEVVTPPQHNPIRVAFTFITAFFTSLVPDTPPPVNAN